MRISIITVSYNAAPTIGMAVASVANQTYREVEHIVVDGASTDRTVELAIAAGRDDILVVSEPDRGIYDAMNKGIARATGEIVGFVNADDMLASHDVLEYLSSKFKDISVDAVFGDLVYVDRDDGVRVRRVWRSSPFTKGLFARGWCPPHPTFYVRRSVYQRLGGFDLMYRIAADVELMMRFLERDGVRAVYLPKLMVKMRVGGVTNRTLSSIYRQNIEILNAARELGVPIGVAGFIASKVIDRLGQRLRALAVARV